MEEIDVINVLAKMILNIFFIYLVYIKITNCNDKNIYITIFMFFCSVNLSLIYTIFSRYFYPLIILLFIYSIYGFIIKVIINNQTNNKIIIYIISCIISYLIYLISMIVSGMLLSMFMPIIDSRSSVSLLMIPIVATFIFNYMFKIKRFKNGFNFLKGIKINENLLNIIISFALITILIFALLQNNNNVVLNSCIFLTTIIISISVIIWIKSQITKTYKSRMRDRTIEMQKTEIDEKSKIMEELKAENIKLASAVHKYNKKFSSLEFAMKNALETGVNTEFANELAVILKETKDASVNFAKEVEIKKNKLPLTNNVGIDNMLKYMQDEARKKDINFEFKLNISINPLLENAISKDKFETLIGDHLKDAIIAVNASSNSYKSILATLGIIDGVYEFSIYDTGIEFEIETLLKLGQEQVTTHKDEGGSGIGFMTTFETLKQCRASLIIEEYNPEITNYTKAVIIRFDGKNQYKIYSYRAEKIKEQKHKRRIIIEKLK